MIELDQNDFNSIGKLRLFLLNDSILVARQKDDVKRGKRDAKLKFEALHLLDDVAVVNMRDIGRKFLSPVAISNFGFSDEKLFQSAYFSRSTNVSMCQYERKAPLVRAT